MPAPGGKQSATSDGAGSAAGLVFRAVDRTTWPDFARLFDGPGGPKNCWCMVFRATPEEQKAALSAGRGMASSGKERAGTSFFREAAMRQRVEDRVPVGLLGYAGGEPVAWCSIAPRETYRRLGGRADPDEPEGSIWSIACFFIRRDFRGRGLTRTLIEAAVAHAGKHGARTVEAYPVAPDASSYRFMGYVPTFSAAGFTQTGRAGTRRTVMRRRVE